MNGERLYLKGWNWVPIDALFGVPRPDRLAHLVALARSAGVDLFRVWGGGLIETEAFYEACNGNTGIAIGDGINVLNNNADSYGDGINVLNGACALPWLWQGPANVFVEGQEATYVACNSDGTTYGDGHIPAT